jgi:glycosyltransferase involved in cell wall biosynthesis
MALFGDLTYDSRVRKEARSLAEAGYDVVIVCLAGGESGQDLPANVTIVVRRPAGPMIIPGSTNPFFSGRAGRIGRVRRRVSWLLAYVRGLRSWGRLAVDAAGPVDAWHAHDLTGLSAIVPSLPSGVPLVYDSHELYLESGTAAMLPRPVRWLLRSYERRCVARAAALITVNDQIAEELTRRYRPGTTAVVHNCPVLESPPPTGMLDRQAEGIPASAPIVMYHGGLAAGRGIEPLMEALLRPGLEDVHLVLMGYGEKRDALRAMTESEPWRERLHVLDAVAPGAVTSWVASADLGVMLNPGRTLNDRYSSPNKLFECLAAGTPVLASDFPTMGRIVLENPEGALGAVCDPGDADAIAASIESIVRLSPADRDALRTRCRRAAEARWNWDVESRGLLGVYAGLDLGHHRQAPQRLTARAG